MRVSPAADKPTADQILRQRNRILASKVFAPSKRMCVFLDYLITEILADRPPRLKELAIGMAVFERDETFDPGLDSIVRVEAIRLRSKLREYYEEDGREDPVVITIPKGSYVPEFTLTHPVDSETPAVQPARSGSLKLTASLILATIVLAGILFALKDPGSPALTTHTGPFSVAVLPLRDWSPHPADYFSEAMTDILIARLSENPELRVTSLSSVLEYTDTELQPSRVAAQLNVEHIIDGSVFRESGRVRVTAELIDGRTNRNLWSETYEKPMTSVLSLQEEIASEIATQLVGKLLPSKRRPVKEVNPAAYEAFLKGRYWSNRLTADGFNRGILYFQQALDMQPDYAEAYAGLAACHCRLGGHGIEIVRPDVALPKAIQLASKALELDNTLAEPNAVLGIINFKYKWDSDNAEHYLQRALANNPSLFEAHLWFSQIYEGKGNHKLAVEWARRAHRLNPLSLAATLNLGWQLYQAGQLVEAENQFDELVEFNPGFWGGHWGKGHCYRVRRMYEEAIAEFTQAVELEGGHTLPIAALGYTYAVAGKRNEALAVIDRLVTLSGDTYVSPIHVAMVYAGLREQDAAFAWLDKAFAVHARSLAWLTVTQELDSLRDDPRYDALVAAIGITGKKI